MLRLAPKLTEVRTLGFSPDNRYLLAVGVNPLLGGLLRFSRIGLWDLSDPAANPTLRIDDGLDPVAGFWLPDGRAIGVDNRGSWRIAGVDSGEVARGDRRDVIGRFRPADVSPDGTRLALIGRNRVHCVPVLGSTEGGPWETSRDNAGEASAVAFSPDGLRLAVGWDDWPSGLGVTVYEVETGAVLVEFPTWRGGLDRLAWSPDGALLAGDGGSQFRVVRADTGQPVAWSERFPRRVTALAFHPTGSVLATAHARGLVRLWGTAGWSAESGAIRSADRGYDWRVGDIQA